MKVFLYFSKQTFFTNTICQVNTLVKYKEIEKNKLKWLRKYQKYSKFDNKSSKQNVL